MQIHASRRVSRILRLVGAGAVTGVLFLGVASSLTSTGAAPRRLEPGSLDERATRQPPASSMDLDCAGVFYPLEVTIEPNEDASPGQVATATLRVSVAAPMGAVELECIPGAELQLLSERIVSLDRLVPGETYEQDLAVRLPASLDRRVVEVTVRGWMNGAQLRRSTIWNLVPGGAEVSREVTRPDGSRVREVAARRVR